MPSFLPSQVTGSAAWLGWHVRIQLTYRPKGAAVPLQEDKAAATGHGSFWQQAHLAPLPGADCVVPAARRETQWWRVFYRVGLYRAIRSWMGLLKSSSVSTGTLHNKLLHVVCTLTKKRNVPPGTHKHASSPFRRIYLTPAFLSLL